ncbi:uncharacterized protein [Symphalangus syndactylus]|uniref:uncharacterized protein n=1 Tax=Symphalangus syndactylus TaxID=9590 RepID=UPI003006012D
MSPAFFILQKTFKNKHCQQRSHWRLTRRGGGCVDLSQLHFTKGSLVDGIADETLGAVASGPGHVNPSQEAVGRGLPRLSPLPPARCPCPVAPHSAPEDLLLKAQLPWTPKASQAPHPRITTLLGTGPSPMRAGGGCICPCTPGGKGGLWGHCPGSPSSGCPSSLYARVPVPQDRRSAQTRGCPARRGRRPGTTRCPLPQCSPVQGGAQPQLVSVHETEPSSPRPRLLQCRDRARRASLLAPVVRTCPSGLSPASLMEAALGLRGPRLHLAGRNSDSGQVLENHTRRALTFTLMLTLHGAAKGWGKPCSRCPANRNGPASRFPGGGFLRGSSAQASWNPHHWA